MKNNITKTIIKWIARLLGFLACLFFLAFFIGEGFNDFKNGIPLELIPMMITIGICIIGYIISWKNSMIGSKLLIIGSICSALYLIVKGGLGDIDAALIYCLPFLIPGLIMLKLSNSN